MFSKPDPTKTSTEVAIDPSLKRREHWIIAGATVALIVLALFVLVTSGKPLPPKGVKIEIKKGAALPAVTEALIDSKVVRSRFLFEALMRLSRADRHLEPGIYLFAQPKNLLRVVWQLRTGDFGVKLIKVTIPEGANNNEVGSILAKALPDFDLAAFNKASAELEGRLFPDTYFLSPLASAEQDVDRLHDAYLDKIQPLRTAISQSGHTENEILTMASLLEEEAKDYQAKRMISGILWQRIAKGMRLQVDAVFPYLIGKNTFTLTRADLANKSLYNTYQYKGLPPGPITNPGFDSIFAALNPQASPYLYYLSDKKGQMHYAATYEEHLKNKRKYLGT